MSDSVQAYNHKNNISDTQLAFNKYQITSQNTSVVLNLKINSVTLIIKTITCGNEVFCFLLVIHKPVVISTKIGFTY